MVWENKLVMVVNLFDKPSSSLYVLILSCSGLPLFSTDSPFVRNRCCRNQLPIPYAKILEPNENQRDLMKLIETTTSVV